MSNPTPQVISADSAANVSPATTLDKRDPLRRQKAVVAMGRRAVAPPERTVLLKDAAALLAEMLETDYGATAEFSTDGESLRMELVLPDAEGAKGESIAHQCSAATTESLCAYATDVALPVVIGSFAEEKRFVDRFLRRHGIRSAVAVPLMLKDRSFGVLAACSKEEKHFDRDDVLFVETMAHLLTTTVARLESEQILREQRRLTEGMLETVDAMVLILDERLQIIDLNRACQKITGFRLEDVRNRALGNVFPVPEETELFGRLSERLAAGESPLYFESYLLTKHSERRRIAWSLRAMTSEKGAVQSVIATGIDVTAQREAEEKAVQALEAAEEAREALAQMAAAEEAIAAGGVEGAFGRMPLPPNAERRRSPRRAYPYTQTVAPVIDGKLPDKSSFVEIDCHDIAAGGFSFFSDAPPASDTVVVALGIPPKVSYLTAQIAHVNRVNKDGKRVFLIGCNYIGRAKY